jgi:transketolase
MDDFAALAAAATAARGLAMDAVAASHSGHLGLPLGNAELGAVLYGRVLRHDPTDPEWLGRDRFVLSAGHGSMFLYAWLHLSGYALPIEEVRRFRQWGSRTPGHPEAHETVGVEATTGPLGQGIGNAVGMAVAAKMMAARYNTPTHRVFDNTIYCLAGDGCMQEGISHEAAAFAGHFKLDNLVLIYDANGVTLDAMASQTQSEDTAKRFEAYGFQVFHVDDGNDLATWDRVLREARDARGKPKLILAHTLIGKGIPQVEGKQKAHGEAGVPFVAEARKGLGLPSEPFSVSPDVYATFAAHRERLAEIRRGWNDLYDAWRRANPSLAEELDHAMSGAPPDNLTTRVPPFPQEKMATRKASEAVLQYVADAMPWLIGASADLYGSTFNYIKASGDFDAAHPEGRNIRAGIREHGMAAIMNGVAYHKGFRPSAATFLTFSDYMRPSIRLAALSHLPVIFIFTHDSVGLGEDGPTHQPVEHLAALRAMPDLDVIRPADPEETAAAWLAALERLDGPTALILTRQNVPALPGSAEQKRRGVARGAYVLVKETAPLETILMATGSEVQHAVSAAATLGPGTRVVSLPCFERFARQPVDYRREVLPPTCMRRVSLEAGVTFGWHELVGPTGRALGIDRFGASAPGAEVLDRLGMNAARLVEAARSLPS